MPKSSKKKKEKAADFSKAKLKLGKGKQLPSNVIDTSFKARSIALPTQSIVGERNDLPTTKRKQSFDALIAHLGHYSAGVRKDALSSMKELFEAFPQIIDKSITTLINSCVRLIGDEDSGVRQGLLRFLTWFLPLVPVEKLLPHSSLILLFTTSAQTNIFPEIRIDAVRFVDLFLDVFPQCVVAGWAGGASGHGKHVLEGYLGILSAGTKFDSSEGKVQATSTASVVLSSKSKALVLTSLSTFLKAALTTCAGSSDEGHFPTWYLLPSFSTAEAFQSYNQLFHSSSSHTRRLWKSEAEFDSSDEDHAYSYRAATDHLASEWNIQRLNEVPEMDDNSTHSKNDASFVVHLARTLHDTILSAFLDCAPSVFSPSSNPFEIEVKLVQAAVDIACTLYRVILQQSAAGPSQARDVACDKLKTLLGFMSTYFPFKPAHRDVKIEHIFQDLNIIYCELTSLLSISSHWRSLSSRQDQTQCQIRKRPQHKRDTYNGSDGKLAMQAQAVSAYIVRLLQWDFTSTALARPLTPTAYAAILPTIWSLLNQPGDLQSEEGTPISELMFSATLDHAIKTSSNVAVKRWTIEFLARITLLETDAEHKGHLGALFRNQHSKFLEWVLHLPRTLSEIQGNDLVMSEIIVRFLLRLLQRGRTYISHELNSGIQYRLTPYFVFTHPVRGRVPGPYTEIPPTSPMRRLVLDLSATVNSMTLPLKASDGQRSAEHESLGQAVEDAVRGTTEESYWTFLNSMMKSY